MAASRNIINDNMDVRGDYLFLLNQRFCQNYGLGAMDPHGSGEQILENLKNVRLPVNYNYSNYDEETSDGHKNHRVHSIPDCRSGSNSRR